MPAAVRTGFEVEFPTSVVVFVAYGHMLRSRRTPWLKKDACYDRGSSFRLKCFLNDGAP